MPTGKVKWFDADKGFGFVSDDAGTDVFLPASALPAGTPTLKGGARVEFGVAQGRKGAQAMNVVLLDPPPSVAAGRHAKHRPPAEQMTVIVEDLITLLDGVSTQLRRGHYPDPKAAGKVAAVLRAVASDLDGA